MCIRDRSYPVRSNVFKVAGGGANYVHGGSSPQEMLVPVLEFKMERGHMEDVYKRQDEMDLSQRLDEMELAIHKPSFRKGTGRANEVNYWRCV